MVAGQTSFSEDIKTHVNNALTDLLTMSAATIVGVDTKNHLVDIEVDVKDTTTNTIKTVPMTKIPYVVHTVNYVDSSGDTITMDSYTPEVGHRVMVGYGEKSMDKAIVMGKVGI